MTNPETEFDEAAPTGSESDTVADAEIDEEATAGEELPDIDTVSDTIEAIVENVETVIVGHQAEIEHIVTALLGRGHVLLEDVPGVGKTMLARAVAQSFDGEFTRIQFTPDLLPSDVTGVNVYDQQSQSFEFRPGPIFGNVVLGDEINRAPPKTQSPLLEAMEENQVTVDGERHTLADPFTVIATQNTVEGDRAYELPLAEIDRFMKKLRLGYPDPDEEAEMLGRVVGDHPIEELTPVTTLAEFRTARAVAANVRVASHVREYATGLANYTRDHAQIGVSPRGSIALVRAAQARAVLDGREYVIPDDVQQEAPAVLPHRIRTGGRGGDDLVTEALQYVPVE